jgi:hypothetical protein
MCSPEFKEGLQYIGKKFNRSVVLDGGMVDVFWLKKEKKLDVSVANIACGYFNHRKDKELIIGKYLNSTLEFCERVATRMKSPSRHSAVIMLPGNVQEIVADRPKVKKSQYCATTICASLLNPNEEYIYCLKCRQKANFESCINKCSKCTKPIFREIELTLSLCLECRPKGFMF